MKQISVYSIVALGLVVVAIVLLGGMAVYWFAPQQVALEYVGYEDIGDAQPGTAWFMVTNAEEAHANYAVQSLGLSLPEVDWDQYYLLVSLGREIRRLSYRRISKYIRDFPVYEGRLIIEPGSEPHRVFYYLTERVRCYQYPE